MSHPRTKFATTIGHDVNSSLSQPLLTYLRRCRPIEGGELKSGKKYLDVFHDVLLSDGTERAKLPDESTEGKVLINLMDKMDLGDKNVNGKSVSLSPNDAWCSHR